jgi:hypothetical protein
MESFKDYIFNEFRESYLQQNACESTPCIAFCEIIYILFPFDHLRFFPYLPEITCSITHIYIRRQ